MDEQMLRRILGEFAKGIMEELERTRKEISVVHATVEKLGENTKQRLDKIEQRLGGIERQLGYVKAKLFEHDEEIFYLRGGPKRF